MKTSKRSQDCNSIKEVLSFVDEKIKENNIDNYLGKQVTLIAEEVMTVIKEEAHMETVNVSFSTGFGDAAFRITFKGELDFDLADYEGDNISIRILSNYSERLKIRYEHNTTTVSILVKQALSKYYRRSIIAFAIAFVAALIMLNFMPESALLKFKEEALYPFIKMVIDAICLIATPVTFLCLSTNIASAVSLNERFPIVRKIELRYLFTSAMAVLLGIIIYLTASPFLSKLDMNFVDHITWVEPFKLSQAWSAITSMVPENIYQPILDNSTVHLCFLAVVFGIALGLVDRETGRVKALVDMLKSLFCKMLSIIVHFTPVIIFLIIMDLVLFYGPLTLFYLAVLLALIIFGCALLCLVYAGMLRFASINIKDFFDNMKECFVEVYKIGSSIDAIPITIKYCWKKLKISRNFLDLTIPIGSAINMDAICLTATLLILTLAGTDGLQLPLSQMLLVALLVMFVSIGAPNQPGTLTIISTVILPQIGVTLETLGTVVLVELILSRMLAMMDVIGDVVCVAVTDKKNQ